MSSGGRRGRVRIYVGVDPREREREFARTRLETVDWIEINLFLLGEHWIGRHRVPGATGEVGGSETP